MCKNSLDRAENILDTRNIGEVDRFYENTIENIPKNVRSSLLHGDLSPDNIIQDDESVAGFIDWDSIKAGDARFEYIEASERMQRLDKPVDAFQNGYQETKPLELEPEVEKAYRMHSNIRFLSATHFLNEVRNADISDRNIEYSIERVNQILNEP